METQEPSNKLKEKTSTEEEKNGAIKKVEVPEKKKMFFFGQPGCLKLSFTQTTSKPSLDSKDANLTQTAPESEKRSSEDLLLLEPDPERKEYLLSKTIIFVIKFE